jgi:hypothetical protein
MQGTAVPAEDIAVVDFGGATVDLQRGLAAGRRRKGAPLDQRILGQRVEIARSTALEEGIADSMPASPQLEAVGESAVAPDRHGRRTHLGARADQLQAPVEIRADRRVLDLAAPAEPDRVVAELTAFRFDHDAAEDPIRARRVDDVRHGHRVRIEAQPRHRDAGALDPEDGLGRRAGNDDDGSGR